MAKVGLGNFFMDAHMTEKCWETVLHFAVCIAGGSVSGLIRKLLAYVGQ
jgi:hypothetical protein